MRLGTTVGIVLLGLSLLTSNGAYAQTRGIALNQKLSGRRLALVVGNDAYVTPLKNAITDARDITLSLRELGFAVDSIVDGRLEDLERAVDKFIAKVQPGDVALFYFSGHGIQIDGENYLLPVDFSASDEIQAKHRSVSAGEVLERMQGRGADIRILILDACRDNPYRQGRSLAAGLARVDAIGTLVAFATSPGSTASDNPAGRNGLFTQQLLTMLKVPGVEASELFRRVRRGVYDASNGRQFPWLSDGLVGEFFFRKGTAQATVVPTPTQDDTAWNSIKDSQDPRQFEQFVLSYGETSRWRVQAKLKLAALRQANQADPSGVPPFSITPGSQPDQTIAVSVRPAVAAIGFRNLSQRSEFTWMSTALAEGASAVLTAGGGLRPIPADRVARLKAELSLADTNELPRDGLDRIRSNVGADLVVSGSYRATGNGATDRIDVDFCVQDTASGDTVTRLSRVGTVGRLFDLLSEAGSTLSAGLGLKPPSSTEAVAIRSSMPASSEATRLYSEGIGRLQISDGLRARDLLIRATVAEPTFALAHAALARAWSLLGSDSSAADEARKAVALSGGLSREDRLWIEGFYRETLKEWRGAIENYQTLFDSHPDRLDYGIRVAETQLLAGQPREALLTIETLRRLPEPARSSPEIDLAEAGAAQSLSDFAREQRVAANAAAKAIASGAWLLVARARIAEGWAFKNLGELNKSESANEEAKRLYLAAGDRRGVARALIQLGSLFRDRGDLQADSDALTEALVIAREVGNARSTAQTLNNLGTVLYEQGRFDEAKALYGESIQLYPTGDKAGLATALANMSAVAEQQNNFAEASDLASRALALRREIGNKGGIALSLLNMAEHVSDQGDLERARRLYEESLALNREIGNQTEAAYSLSGLGTVLLRQGKMAEARADQQEALTIRQQAHETTAIGESRLALAEIMIEEGRLDSAAAAAREVVGVARDQKDQELETLSYLTMAAALLAGAKTVEAQDALARIDLQQRSHWSYGTKLLADIVGARVAGASGRVQVALSNLEHVIAQTSASELIAYVLEARLAHVEVSQRNGKTDGLLGEVSQLEEDASARGFVLVSKKAAAIKSAIGR